MAKRVWTVLWIMALVVSASACNGEEPQPQAADYSAVTLLIETEAFEAGETIPEPYTCDGDDLSPALRWSEPPAGTQSLALIFDDVDAPMRTWVHWVLFNIPASTRALPEGIADDAIVTGLGVHGSNSWKALGYGGPCPPKGSPHRYTFRLYALDAMLDLEAGASRADLDSAMEGHILGEGQLVGLYGR